MQEVLKRLTSTNNEFLRENLDEIRNLDGI